MNIRKIILQAIAAPIERLVYYLGVGCHSTIDPIVIQTEKRKMKYHGYMVIRPNKIKKV